MRSAVATMRWDVVNPARDSPPPSLTLGTNTQCVYDCAMKNIAFMATGGCRTKDIRSIIADKSQRGNVSYLRGANNKEWYLP